MALRELRKPEWGLWWTLDSRILWFLWIACPALGCPHASTVHAHWHWSHLTEKLWMSEVLHSYALIVLMAVSIYQWLTWKWSSSIAWTLLTRQSWLAAMLFQVPEECTWSIKIPCCLRFGLDPRSQLVFLPQYAQTSIHLPTWRCLESQTVMFCWPHPMARCVGVLKQSTGSYGGHGRATLRVNLLATELASIQEQSWPTSRSSYSRQRSISGSKMNGLCPTMKRSMENLLLFCPSWPRFRSTSRARKIFSVILAKVEVNGKF